ncbi:MAG: 8-oxo-dGTP diphosphatase MutT [Gammaproteobacteria bacterium]
MRPSSHAAVLEVTSCVRVAAAVIRRGDGQVLLARRRPDVHQGGLWEFPGGKIEAGESTVDALARELFEELGIVIEAATPLIRVCHAYPDKHVDIAALEVRAWYGEPHGREGQPLRWVTPEALPDYPLPAANLPIVTAAVLPRVALAMSPPNPGGSSCMADLEQALAAGVRLLRLPAADAAQPACAALLARWRCKHVRVMVDGSLATAVAAGVDGVHLAAGVETLPPRGARGGLLVSSDVSDADDLARAEAAGVDFVYAARTLSAPDIAGLAATAGVPIYAHGDTLDAIDACHAGCQGSVVKVGGVADLAPLAHALAAFERNVAAVTVSTGSR